MFDTSSVKLSRLATFIFSMTAQACLNQASEPSYSIPPVVLSVGTFNVRYNDPNDGENAWPHRKDFVFEIIRSNEIGVWGLQEILSGDQFEDFINEFSEDFGFVIRPDRDQHDIIIYDKTLWKLIDKGFSYEMEPPGYWQPAYVIWARLYHISTGLEFTFANTHLDGSLEQIKSARKFLESLEKPLILFGDFNSFPVLNPYNDELPGMDVMKEGNFLIDVFGQLHKNNRQTSGCGFEPTCPDLTFDARIDWIMADQRFKTLSSEIMIVRKNEKNPSDHFPTVAEIEYEWRMQ